MLTWWSALGLEFMLTSGVGSRLVVRFGLGLVVELRSRIW